MTDEHIEKSKSAVEAAGHVPAEKKAELLGVLSKLQPALAKVAQTHEEDAHSIARLIEASAHEATRKKKRPELLETILRGLKQSVDNFEASHPDLVAFASEYSAVLSALGI